jgi:hypothetical protein
MRAWPASARSGTEAPDRSRHGSAQRSRTSSGVRGPERLGYLRVERPLAVAVRVRSPTVFHDRDFRALAAGRASSVLVDNEKGDALHRRRRHDRGTTSHAADAGFCRPRLTDARSVHRPKSSWLRRQPEPDFGRAVRAGAVPVIESVGRGFESRPALPGAGSSAARATDGGLPPAGLHSTTAHTRCRGRPCRRRLTTSKRSSRSRHGSGKAGAELRTRACGPEHDGYRRERPGFVAGGAGFESSLGRAFVGR